MAETIVSNQKDSDCLTVLVEPLVIYLTSIREEKILEQTLLVLEDSLSVKSKPVRSGTI